MKIHSAILAAVIASMLAACASAPKPPNVSGRKRVDINSTADVRGLALQVFPEAPAAVEPAHKVDAVAPASRTVSVHFPWNRSTFQPTRQQAAALRSLLGDGYARIEVRGRTDAARPSAGDETIAARRAAAARDWLIHQGVPARVISVNYASAADPIGGNNYSGGRALNRRVDIEIIRK